MKRINQMTYFLALAKIVSLRSTCARRQVGCVLVDNKNHILATGYNGVTRKAPHCIDIPCPGASYESGKGLDVCEAIHAEQNAILQCSDVDQIQTAYITVAPCKTCTKLLSNTACREIVFLENYVDSGKALWRGVWHKHNDIKEIFELVANGR